MVTFPLFCGLLSVKKSLFQTNFFLSLNKKVVFV